MNEHACQFGPSGQAAGIITLPSSGPPRAGCVLVSAGLVPKQGPFRLYTMLARRLAREGFATLRFDLSGIGSGRSEWAGVPLRQRTELEIRAAIDHLTGAHPVRALALGGLCSGAEDSFRYAESDPRVTSVVMIDPFAYPTRGWALRHFLHRATRRTLALMRLYEPLAFAPVAPARGAEERRRVVAYEYMAKEESTRVLRKLVARGVQTHFIYTGGMADSFNHDAQLAKMFPDVRLDGLVTVDRFPRLDHTQVFEEDRKALVEAIARRLASATRAHSRCTAQAQTPAVVQPA